MPEQKSPKRVIALVFIIAILATSAFFRIWHLSNIPGLNGDEAYYGVNSLNIIQGNAYRWFTPSGNLHNIFYFVPSILLHAIFPPSIALLRSIAVICGLLALVVNYRLCKRVFGLPTAIASTLILASLPEAIAQGRFGWDPAQSLLADAFVLYLSLLIVTEPTKATKWTFWAIVAFIASLSVHPSNFFIGPYLGLAILWRWRTELTRLFFPRQMSLKSIIAYLVTFAALVCFGILLHRRIDLGFSKVFVAQLVAFPFYYVSLFNGMTVYQYIAGSFMPTNTPGYITFLWTAMTFIVFGATLVYGIILLTKKTVRQEVDGLVFAGWLLSSFLFFALGRQYLFTSGSDRYALCLILPGILAVCRFVLRVTERKQVLRFAAIGVGSLTCVTLLISFYVCYFRFIEVTGVQSENAFSTGPTEPKLAAWQFIESHAQPNAPIIILTSVYWNYQPLLYLSKSDPRAVVIRISELENPAERNALNAAIAQGVVWSVEFSGSEESKHIVDLAQAQRVPLAAEPIPDYTGRPTIDVIHWNPQGQFIAK